MTWGESIEGGCKRDSLSANKRPACAIMGRMVFAGGMGFNKQVCFDGINVTADKVQNNVVKWIVETREKGVDKR